MRVEDCIFNVERRSIGGCLDLAVTFARQFAIPILRLQLLFAIPSCWLVWYLSQRYTDMLLISLYLFAFFCTFFSGALVAAIGPQVFGVPISTRAALRQLLNRIFSYSFLSGLVRLTQWIGSFCLYLPSLLVTAFFGHVAEVVFLEQSTANKVTSRLGSLNRGGGYGRHLLAIIFLLVFWLLTSLGLFLIIDLLFGILFNSPILIGRVSGGPDFTEEFFGLLQEDPLVLTNLQVSLWLMFPIGSLGLVFLLFGYANSQRMLGYRSAVSNRSDTLGRY